MGACCASAKGNTPDSPELRVIRNGCENHSDTNQKPLSVRDPAPKWSGPAVVSGMIKDISMDDYKGKYLVFFFYPLDFSFVCPTEIMAFSDRYPDFKSLNCELVACSTDSVYAHLAWTLQAKREGGLGPLNIPLLSDNTHKISQSYQVYKEDDGTTFRGLFIIDPVQNLRQITVNDTQVGRSVDEILRLIQAFQYTDIHGEVCQAGWKPGDKGIKPGKSDNKSASPRGASSSPST